MELSPLDMNIYGGFKKYTPYWYNIYQTASAAYLLLYYVWYFIFFFFYPHSFYFLGIFAYLNYCKEKKRCEILHILIDGLKRQEYRGYDSAGIAFDTDSMIDKSSNECEIKLIRQKGKVEKLESAVFEQENIDYQKELKSHLGIAHTRWATHGEPSAINSHPQPSDPSNEFLVVHNGIITNYKDIKKFLGNHGYSQVSETDTELIVLLYKYFNDKYYKKEKQLSLLELTKLVVELVEGAYALVVKSRHFPTEMIGTKRSSPLIIGLKTSDSSLSQVPVIYNQKDFKFDDFGKNVSSTLIPGYTFDPSCGVEYFFASDASAIIEHTNKVIYLLDDDIAYVKDGYLTIQRQKLDEINDNILLEETKTLQIELQQIMKGSFSSYMEKEIFEQPESVYNTMRGRVNFETKTVKLGGIQSHISIIQRCRRLIFVACGTSYHSCLAVRQILEELTDLPIMLEWASDLLDRSMPIFRDDVCIFVSQSGETADTLNALRYCKSFGAFVMGVTNVVGSTISRETTCGIHLNAGPEIGVASTKAYTSQIVALLLFGCVLASDKISKRQKIEECIDSLRQLPDVIKKCLESYDHIKVMAKKYFETRSCLLVGRGVHSATCLEGALKVKEISYIHSEGILSGELKHGPLALVDESMLVITIITDCRITNKCVNAIQQILARKVKPLVITDCEDKFDSSQLEEIIHVPHIIDCLQTIPAIIPLQLLALQLAQLRGHDVDCPRNLAKSVTVE